MVAKRGTTPSFTYTESTTQDVIKQAAGMNLGTMKSYLLTNTNVSKAEITKANNKSQLLRLVHLHARDASQESSMAADALRLVEQETAPEPRDLECHTEPVAMYAELVPDMVVRKSTSSPAPLSEDLRAQIRQLQSEVSYYDALLMQLVERAIA